MQRDNRRTGLLLIAAATLTIAAAGIEYWPSSTALPWLTLAEARAEALRSNKAVFIDVYASWCAPCKTMDRVVFPHDSVRQALTERFILARVNIDDPVEGDSVKKEFRVRALPTYIVVTPHGREVKRQTGYIPVTEFVDWLTDSSLLPVFRWPYYDMALHMATERRRPVMVLVASSSADMAFIDSYFDPPEVRLLIDSLYTPTVLVQDRAESDRVLRAYGVHDYPLASLNGLVMIVDPRRQRETGRIMLVPSMRDDPASLVRELQKHGSSVPAFRAP